MAHMKTTDNSHVTRPPISPSGRSPEYGELQRLVDKVYEVNPSKPRSKLDVVTCAEMLDLGEELMEVIDLLPGGSYKRFRLCDQLNSIVTAHGWAWLFGTVE